MACARSCPARVLPGVARVSLPARSCVCVLLWRGAVTASLCFTVALPGCSLMILWLTAALRHSRGAWRVRVYVPGAPPVRVLSHTRALPAWRIGAHARAYSRRFCGGAHSPRACDLSCAGALSAPAYSPAQDCKGAHGVFPYGSRRVYSRGGVHTHSPRCFLVCTHVCNVAGV